MIKGSEFFTWEHLGLSTGQCIPNITTLPYNPLCHNVIDLTDNWYTDKVIEAKI